MFRSLLIGAAAIGMAGPALAQTPAPPPLKVLMENERVRVVEVALGARGKATIGGTERERVLYMLTDGALLFAPPGRPSYVLTLNAGEAVWFPPASPTVENEGNETVRLVVIELRRGSPGPRVAQTKLKPKKARLKAKVKGPPKARPKPATKRK